MASRCPGLFCQTSRDKKKRIGTDISFHRFPKDETRRAMWLRVCEEDFEPNQNTLLCSRHFEPSQFFVHPAMKKRRLDHNAIPSLIFKSAEDEKLINIDKPNQSAAPCLLNDDPEVRLEIEAPRSLKEDPETLPEIETIWFPESSHLPSSECSDDTDHETISKLKVESVCSFQQERGTTLSIAPRSSSNTRDGDETAFNFSLEDSGECDKSKKKKKRVGYALRSKWWSFFNEVTDENGEKLASCKYCSTKYKKNGTGNMAVHIKHRHLDKLPMDHNQPTLYLEKQQNLEELGISKFDGDSSQELPVQLPKDYNQPILYLEKKENQEELEISKFDSDSSQELLVQFVVNNNHPFTIVEETCFQSFVRSINPEFKLLSTAALKTRILETFHAKNSLTSITPCSSSSTRDGDETAFNFSLEDSGECDKSKKKKKRIDYALRSKWWSFFDEVTDRNGEKLASCKYCSTKYKKNGTGNMAIHIKHRHYDKLPKDRNQPTLYFENQHNQQEPGVFKLDNDYSQELLVQFIVNNNHPFSIVEEPCFQSFVQSINPEFKLLNAATLKTLILEKLNTKNSLTSITTCSSSNTRDGNETAFNFSLEDSGECDKPKKKKKRIDYALRSKWWNFFDEVTGGNGEKLASCKYCSTKYKKNGTGNMAAHITVRHYDKLPMDHSQPNLYFENQQNQKELGVFKFENDCSQELKIET